MLLRIMTLIPTAMLSHRVISEIRRSNSSYESRRWHIASAPQHQLSLLTARPSQVTADNQSYRSVTAAINKLPTVQRLNFEEGEFSGVLTVQYAMSKKWPWKDSSSPGPQAVSVAAAGRQAAGRWEVATLTQQTSVFLEDACQSPRCSTGS